MSGMAFEPPREEDYPPGFLHALGHIIALWSNVEREVEHALYTLSDIKGRDALLILGHMDLRSSSAALKAVAFLKMDIASFERLEVWVNDLNGDFRNYRNRLVHDLWRPFPEDTALGVPFVHRGTVASKVVKTPASGEKKLRVSNHQPVGIEELKLFAEDLKDAWRFFAHVPMYTKGRGFPDCLPDPTSRYKSPPPYPRSSPGFDQRTYKPEPPPES